MIPKPVAVQPDRRETTRHNVSGFALAGYTSRFSSATYDYVDWHWHTEFQLCLVTGGSVCFRVEDGQYAQKCGEGIFINSQRVHMARPYRCGEASYFCVDFHPDLICGDRRSGLYRSHVLPALGNASLCAVPLFPKEASQNAVLAALGRIWPQFSAKEPGYELDMVIGILEAWKNLVPLLPECDVPQDGAGGSRLKQILLFVQEHYAEPLTLSRIADCVHLSRSECCRYFRKAAGQPLFEYITQYRIDRSADLLLQTGLRVCEIAAEVGFSGQSYYTECFRRIKKTTPKEFRLRHTDGGTGRE